MFEKYVIRLLVDILNKFADDVNEEQLTISILKGQALLQNLKLKPSVVGGIIYPEAPEAVRRAVCSNIVINIPSVASLQSKPCLVSIKGIYIGLQAPMELPYNKDGQRQRDLATKKAIVQMFETKRKQMIEKELKNSLAGNSDNDSESGSYMYRLKEAIINNIVLSIQSVHIRYESVSRGIVIGALFSSVGVKTTDELGNPIFVNPDQTNKIIKNLTFEGLQVYTEFHHEVVSRHQHKDVLYKKSDNSKGYTGVNVDHSDESMAKIFFTLIPEDEKWSEAMSARVDEREEKRESTIFGPVNGSVMAKVMFKHSVFKNLDQPYIDVVVDIFNFVSMITRDQFLAVVDTVAQLSNWRLIAPFYRFRPNKPPHSIMSFKRSQEAEQGSTIECHNTTPSTTGNINREIGLSDIVGRNTNRNEEAIKWWQFAIRSTLGLIKKDRCEAINAAVSAFLSPMYTKLFCKQALTDVLKDSTIVKDNPPGGSNKESSKWADKMLTAKETSTLSHLEAAMTSTDIIDARIESYRQVAEEVREIRKCLSEKKKERAAVRANTWFGRFSYSISGEEKEEEEILKEIEKEWGITDKNYNDDGTFNSDSVTNDSNRKHFQRILPSHYEKLKIKINLPLGGSRIQLSEAESVQLYLNNISISALVYEGDTISNNNGKLGCASFSITAGDISLCNPNTATSPSIPSLIKRHIGPGMDAATSAEKPLLSICGVINPLPVLQEVALERRRAPKEKGGTFDLGSTAAANRGGGEPLTESDVDESRLDFLLDVSLLPLFIIADPQMFITFREFFSLPETVDISGLTSHGKELVGAVGTMATHQATVALQGAKAFSVCIDVWAPVLVLPQMLSELDGPCIVVSLGHLMFNTKPLTHTEKMHRLQLANGMEEEKGNVCSHDNRDDSDKTPLHFVKTVVSNQELQCYYYRNEAIFGDAYVTCCSLRNALTDTYNGFSIMPQFSFNTDVYFRVSPHHTDKPLVVLEGKSPVLRLCMSVHTAYLITLMISGWANKAVLTSNGSGSIGREDMIASSAKISFVGALSKGTKEMNQQLHKTISKATAELAREERRSMGRADGSKHSCEKKCGRDKRNDNGDDELRSEIQESDCDESTDEKEEDTPFLQISVKISTFSLEVFDDKIVNELCSQERNSTTTSASDIITGGSQLSTKTTVEHNRAATTVPAKHQISQHPQFFVCVKPLVLIAAVSKQGEIMVQTRLEELHGYKNYFSPPKNRHTDNAICPQIISHSKTIIGGGSTFVIEAVVPVQPKGILTAANFAVQQKQQFGIINPPGHVRESCYDDTTCEKLPVSVSLEIAPIIHIHLSSCFMEMCEQSMDVINMLTSTVDDVNITSANSKGGLHGNINSASQGLYITGDEIAVAAALLDLPVVQIKSNIAGINLSLYNNHVYTDHGIKKAEEAKRATMKGTSKGERDPNYTGFSHITADDDYMYATASVTDIDIRIDMRAVSIATIGKIGTISLTMVDTTLPPMYRTVLGPIQQTRTKKRHHNNTILSFTFNKSPKVYPLVFDDVTTTSENGSKVKERKLRDSDNFSITSMLAITLEPSRIVYDCSTVLGLMEWMTQGFFTRVPALVVRPRYDGRKMLVMNAVPRTLLSINVAVTRPVVVLPLHCRKGRIKAPVSSLDSETSSQAPHASELCSDDNNATYLGASNEMYAKLECLKIWNTFSVEDYSETFNLQLINLSVSDPKGAKCQTDNNDKCVSQDNTTSEGTGCDLVSPFDVEITMTTNMDPRSVERDTSSISVRDRKGVSLNIYTGNMMRRVLTLVSYNICNFTPAGPHVSPTSEQIAAHCSNINEAVYRVTDNREIQNSLVLQEENNNLHKNVKGRDESQKSREPEEIKPPSITHIYVNSIAVRCYDNGISDPQFNIIINCFSLDLLVGEIKVRWGSVTAIDTRNLINALELINCGESSIEILNNEIEYDNNHEDPSSVACNRRKKASISEMANYLNEEHSRGEMQFTEEKLKKSFPYFGEHEIVEVDQGDTTAVGKRIMRVLIDFEIERMAVSAQWITLCDYLLNEENMTIMAPLLGRNEGTSQATSNGTDASNKDRHLSNSNEISPPTTTTTSTTTAQKQFDTEMNVSINTRKFVLTMLSDANEELFLSTLEGFSYKMLTRSWVTASIDSSNNVATKHQSDSVTECHSTSRGSCESLSIIYFGLQAVTITHTDTGRQILYRRHSGPSISMDNMSGSETNTSTCRPKESYSATLPLLEISFVSSAGSNLIRMQLRGLNAYASMPIMNQLIYYMSDESQPVVKLSQLSAMKEERARIAALAFKEAKKGSSTVEVTWDCPCIVMPCDTRDDCMIVERRLDCVSGIGNENGKAEGADQSISENKDISSDRYKHLDNEKYMQVYPPKGNQLIFSHVSLGEIKNSPIYQSVAASAKSKGVLSMNLGNLRTEITLTNQSKNVPLRTKVEDIQRNENLTLSHETVAPLVFTFPIDDVILVDDNGNKERKFGNKVPTTMSKLHVIAELTQLSIPDLLSDTTITCDYLAVSYEAVQKFRRDAAAFSIVQKGDEESAREDIAIVTVPSSSTTYFLPSTHESVVVTIGSPTTVFISHDTLLKSSSIIYNNLSMPTRLYIKMAMDEKARVILEERLEKSKSKMMSSITSNNGNIAEKENLSQEREHNDEEYNYLPSAVPYFVPLSHSTRYYAFEGTAIYFKLFNCEGGLFTTVSVGSIKAFLGGMEESNQDDMGVFVSTLGASENVIGEIKWLKKNTYSNIGISPCEDGDVSAQRNVATDNISHGELEEAISIKRKREWDTHTASPVIVTSIDVCGLHFVLVPKVIGSLLDLILSAFGSSPSDTSFDTSDVTGTTSASLETKDTDNASTVNSKDTNAQLSGRRGFTICIRSSLFDLLESSHVTGDSVISVSDTLEESTHSNNLGMRTGSYGLLIRMCVDQSVVIGESGIPIDNEQVREVFRREQTSMEGVTTSSMIHVNVGSVAIFDMRSVQIFDGDSHIAYCSNVVLSQRLSNEYSDDNIVEGCKRKAFSPNFSSTNYPILRNSGGRSSPNSSFMEVTLTSLDMPVGVCKTIAQCQPSYFFGSVLDVVITSVDLSYIPSLFSNVSESFTEMGNVVSNAKLARDRMSAGATSVLTDVKRNIMKPHIVLNRPRLMLIVDRVLSSPSIITANKSSMPFNRVLSGMDSIEISPGTLEIVCQLTTRESVNTSVNNRTESSKGTAINSLPDQFLSYSVGIKGVGVQVLGKEALVHNGMIEVQHTSKLPPVKVTTSVMQACEAVKTDDVNHISSAKRNVDDRSTKEDQYDTDICLSVPPMTLQLNDQQLYFLLKFGGEMRKEYNKESAKRAVRKQRHGSVSERRNTHFEQEGVTNKSPHSHHVVPDVGVKACHVSSDVRPHDTRCKRKSPPVKGGTYRYSLSIASLFIHLVNLFDCRVDRLLATRSRYMKIPSVLGSDTSSNTTKSDGVTSFSTTAGEQCPVGVKGSSVLTSQEVDLSGCYVIETHITVKKAAIFHKQWSHMPENERAAILAMDFALRQKKCGIEDIASKFEGETSEILWMYNFLENRPEPMLPIAFLTIVEFKSSQPADLIDGSNVDTLITVQDAEVVLTSTSIRDFLGVIYVPVLDLLLHQRRTPTPCIHLRHDPYVSLGNINAAKVDRNFVSSSKKREFVISNLHYIHVSGDDKCCFELDLDGHTLVLEGPIPYAHIVLAENVHLTIKNGIIQIPGIYSLSSFVHFSANSKIIIDTNTCKVVQKLFNKSSKRKKIDNKKQNRSNTVEKPKKTVTHLTKLNFNVGVQLITREEAVSRFAKKYQQVREAQDIISPDADQCNIGRRQGEIYSSTATIPQTNTGVYNSNRKGSLLGIMHSHETNYTDDTFSASGFLQSSLFLDIGLRASGSAIVAQHVDESTGTIIRKNISFHADSLSSYDGRILRPTSVDVDLSGVDSIFISAVVGKIEGVLNINRIRKIILMVMEIMTAAREGISSVIVRGEGDVCSSPQGNITDVNDEQHSIDEITRGQMSKMEKGKRRESAVKPQMAEPLTWADFVVHTTLRDEATNKLYYRVSVNRSSGETSAVKKTCKNCFSKSHALYTVNDSKSDTDDVICSTCALGWSYITVCGGEVRCPLVDLLAIGDEGEMAEVMVEGFTASKLDMDAGPGAIHNRPKNNKTPGGDAAQLDIKDQKTIAAKIKVYSWIFNTNFAVWEPVCEKMTVDAKICLEDRIYRVNFPSQTNITLSIAAVKIMYRLIMGPSEANTTMVDPENKNNKTPEDNPDEKSSIGSSHLLHNFPLLPPATSSDEAIKSDEVAAYSLRSAPEQIKFTNFLNESVAIIDVHSTEVDPTTGLTSPKKIWLPGGDGRVYGIGGGECFVCRGDEKVKIYLDIHAFYTVGDLICEVEFLRYEKSSSQDENIEGHVQQFTDGNQSASAGVMKTRPRINVSFYPVHQSGTFIKIHNDVSCAIYLENIGIVDPGEEIYIPPQLPLSNPFILEPVAVGSNDIGASPTSEMYGVAETSHKSEVFTLHSILNGRVMETIASSTTRKDAYVVFRVTSESDGSLCGTPRFTVRIKGGCSLTNNLSFPINIDILRADNSRSDSREVTVSGHKSTELVISVTLQPGNTKEIIYSTNTSGLMFCLKALQDLSSSAKVEQDRREAAKDDLIGDNIDKKYKHCPNIVAYLSSIEEVSTGTHPIRMFGTAGDTLYILYTVNKTMNQIVLSTPFSLLNHTPLELLLSEENPGNAAKSGRSEGPNWQRLPPGMNTPFAAISQSKIHEYNAADPPELFVKFQVINTYESNRVILSTSHYLPLHSVGSIGQIEMSRGNGDGSDGEESVQLSYLTAFGNTGGLLVTIVPRWTVVNRTEYSLFLAQFSPASSREKSAFGLPTDCFVKGITLGGHSSVPLYRVNKETVNENSSGNAITASVGGGSGYRLVFARNKESLMYTARRGGTRAGVYGYSPFDIMPVSIESLGDELVCVPGKHYRSDPDLQLRVSIVPEGPRTYVIILQPPVSSFIISNRTSKNVSLTLPLAKLIPMKMTESVLQKKNTNRKNEGVKSNRVHQVTIMGGAAAPSSVHEVPVQSTLHAGVSIPNAKTGASEHYKGRVLGFAKAKESRAYAFNVSSTSIFLPCVDLTIGVTPINDDVNCSSSSDMDLPTTVPHLPPLSLFSKHTVSFLVPLQAADGGPPSPSTIYRLEGHDFYCRVFQGTLGQILLEIVEDEHQANNENKKSIDTATKYQSNNAKPCVLQGDSILRTLEPSAGKSLDVSVLFKFLSISVVDQPREITFGAIIDTKICLKRQDNLETLTFSILNYQFDNQTEQRPPYETCFFAIRSPKSNCHAVNIMLQRRIVPGKLVIQFTEIRIDICPLGVRLSDVLLVRLHDFYQRMILPRKQVENSSSTNSLHKSTSEQHDGRKDPYHYMSNKENYGNAGVISGIMTCLVSIERMVINPIVMRLWFARQRTCERMDIVRHTAENEFLSFCIVSCEDVMLRVSGLTVQSQSGQLQSLIAKYSKHFIDGAKDQVLAVLFQYLSSVPLLGAPVKLVTDIGVGTVLLFQEPIEGLTESPEAFALGIARGTASFAGNVVGGSLNMIGNVVGSTAKMASVISGHRSDKKKVNTFTGFVEGFSGIVTKPMQGAAEGGVAGLFKGIGQGVIGVAASPVAGILNDVAHATNTAGNVLKDTYIAELHRLRPIRLFLPGGAVSSVDSVVEVFQYQRRYSGDIKYTDSLLITDGANWKPKTMREMQQQYIGKIFDHSWILDRCAGTTIDGWVYAKNIESMFGHINDEEKVYVRRRRWVAIIKDRIPSNVIPSLQSAETISGNSINTNPDTADMGSVSRRTSSELSHVPTTSAASLRATTRCHDQVDECNLSTVRVIEVFEYQRSYPFIGFSAKLLPTDRPAWADRSGRGVPSKESFPLPVGWMWTESDWQSLGGDSDGWEYAVDFPMPYSPRKSPVDLVRRRCWRRTMKKK